MEGPAGPLPGVALAATPVIFLISLLPDLPELPDSYLEEGRFTERWKLGVYLGTIVTSGLFTAAAAAAIYLIALDMRASVSGALVAALGFGLASPAWGWAANFFGHAYAGALLFLGFAVVHHLVRGVGSNPRRDIIGGLVAGCLLGWSIVVDFTSAPAALFIGVYGVASARSWPLARLGRVALPALGAAIVAIIPLLIYNNVSFGSPFTLGYQQHASFAGFEEGLLGISYPRLEALYGITLSPYRGLIVFCPALLLAPFAIYGLARTRGARGVAYLSASVALYFLLLNSSFYYWDGGASTGPRYLTPMLPFLFLPFALFWTSRSSNMTRALILTLLVLSFGISLISVSTTMAAPQDFKNPLFQLLLPRFLNGDVQTVLVWMGWRSGYAVLLHVLVLAVSVGLIWLGSYWRRPDTSHFARAQQVSRGVGDLQARSVDG